MVSQAILQLDVPGLEDPVRQNPPLKWAGGKRWLVPRLSALWEKHTERRLVEPFVGGLAVALGLSPERALLNDLNSHLIYFYKWLQVGFSAADAQVEFLNDTEVFYKNRARFNELVGAGKADSLEASVLFFYLNRTCFNGLCRFNAKGFFNVPFGKYKNIAYRSNFNAYQEALKNFEFRAGDFESLEIGESDFVYADPPYDVQFTTYSAGGFTWDDQVRLASWLSRHKGPVVASNQATPRILSLYSELGFVVETVSAPRRISCDGNREDAQEMFAIKGGV